MSFKIKGGGKVVRLRSYKKMSRDVNVDKKGSKTYEEIHQGKKETDASWLRNDLGLPCNSPSLNGLRTSPSHRGIG